MTLCDPLYPTIFNMVVDAVLRQWVMGMSEEEGVPYCFGRAVQNMAVIFYANDSLLVSTSNERLHRAFNNFTAFFDRMGL